jgi:hypothetical protein
MKDELISKAYFTTEEKLKKKQMKVKGSRRKERIKIGAQIYRKTTEKNHKIKSWIFKKINKINKCLARYCNEKVSSKEEDIVTDFTEMKRIIEEYYEVV